MILYHGSYKAIEKPDLAFSRKLVDFGPGFYVTPLRGQAAGWTARFRKEGKPAVVSLYGFLQRPVEEILPDNIKILEFDSHSIEWLTFITDARLGRPGDEEWDLIMGGVANDKVFDTLQLYFDGLLPAEEAIRRLRYNKPNYQYCFKNQWLIDNYLKFIEAEEL
ncbi:MAG: DUF3990 domain-containing protein [Gracilibacteraceae bacterium]|jgi:hypothetical protein|nr:DUF3990 domain-containing protein [Gracilibacteraceae bacterium]